LVHAGCSAEAPVWSPDGRRLLALLSARRVGLFTMSPDGAHRHFVVFGFEADWQPTSR
jgi:hypothetical protein